MKLYGVEGESEGTRFVRFVGDGWRAALTRKRGTQSWSWRFVSCGCRIEEPFVSQRDAVEAALALVAALKRLGVRVPGVRRG